MVHMVHDLASTSTTEHEKAAGDTAWSILYKPSHTHHPAIGVIVNKRGTALHSYNSSLCILFYHFWSQQKEAPGTSFSCSFLLCQVQSLLPTSQDIPWWARAVLPNHRFSDFLGLHLPEILGAYLEVKATGTFQSKNIWGPNVANYRAKKHQRLLNATAAQFHSIYQYRYSVPREDIRRLSELFPPPVLNRIQRHSAVIPLLLG